MLNEEIYFKNICSKLSQLCVEVKFLNSVNLYDMNIVAEDFYAKLLNMIYGYNLRNLNEAEKNAPAIDLVDEQARIAIQVTANNSSTKIKETIQKFIDHNQYLKYDRLIVLIVTEKQKYTTTFDTKGKFKFEKKTDIIDCTDLIQNIKSRTTETLKRINQFLELELANKIENQKTTHSSEVDTIIDLIEYITKNRDSKRRLDVIIDPDYKIYNRFKDFAKKITGDYTTYYTIYGSVLDAVYKILEVDEAQDLITIMYLQDISIKILNETQDNPVEALEKLVDYFGEKLHGKKYDRAAIKFYLISQMIKCNVFPNERSAYNDDK